MSESNQNRPPDSNRDFELYKLFIDQVQHDHTRWVDNFGVLTTWNAIVLAVTVTSTMGIFGYLGGGCDNPPCSTAQSLPFSLIPLALSFIGISIAFITLFVVLRIHSSSQDWYDRIRFFEGKIWPPSETDEEKQKETEEVRNEIVPAFRVRTSKAFVCRGVKGLHLYVAVCWSFIIIYNLIAWVVFSWSFIIIYDVITWLPFSWSFTIIYDVIAWVLFSWSIPWLCSATLPLSYSRVVWLVLTCFNKHLISAGHCADWDTNDKS